MLDVWLSFVFFLGADWIYLITFSIVRFVFNWAVELYNFLVEIYTLLRSFFITCFDVVVNRVTSQINSHPSFDNISLFTISH